MEKIRMFVVSIPRRLSGSSYQRCPENDDRDGPDEERASFLPSGSSQKLSISDRKLSNTRRRKCFIVLLIAFFTTMLVATFAIFFHSSQNVDVAANEDSKQSGHTDHIMTKVHNPNEDGEAYKAVLLQKPKPGDYLMREPCGSTPEEAMERGCRFDVASFCWLPDACYDGGLGDQFENYREWEWFLDPEKTKPLSRDQIITGQYPEVFVKWDYHIRHCTAMWMKMHRALMGPGISAVDSYIGNIHHTHHCGEMLLDRETGTEVLNTIILVKYPDCGLAR